MARERRRTLALALSALATLAPAAAAALPTLHVTTLGMHADRLAVRAGEAFHVTIHVHVAERGIAIAPMLILPNLDNLDDLGDERHSTSGPDGTDFTEVLTLAGRAPGDAALTPAYLDAIDAKTGRPSRFSSQPLRIRITAAAGAVERAAPAFEIGHFVTIAALSLGAFVLAGVGAAIVFLARRGRRTPAEVIAPPPIVVPPPAPPPSPDARLRTALAAFREGRGDAQRIALRAELFAFAGVPAGATLADALRTVSERTPLRAAMLAAEAAVFGRPAERAAADARLIDAASTLLESGERTAWTA